MIKWISIHLMFRRASISGLLSFVYFGTLHFFYIRSNRLTINFVKLMHRFIWSKFSYFIFEKVIVFINLLLCAKIYAYWKFYILNKSARCLRRKKITVLLNALKDAFVCFPIHNNLLARLSYNTLKGHVGVCNHADSEGEDQTYK